MTSGTTTNLTGVTYTGSVWVAVGNGGLIRTSPDGATWTPQTSGTTNSLFGVATGPAVLAVGQGSTVLTAPLTADSWTVVSQWFSATLNAVAYGNGTFVAVDDVGTAHVSADGLAWTSHATGASRLTDVHFANGTFVAVNPDVGSNQPGAYTSSDGTSWAAHNVPQGYTNVTYAGGTWFATGQGNGTIGTSPDANTWTAMSTAASGALSGLAFGNGVYVIGFQVGNVVRSTNGTTWSLVNGSLPSFPAITFGNGLFVSAGFNGAIHTSPDGITWTARSSGTNDALGGSWFNGVTYDSGQFVVLGTNGRILTSTDGITWTSRTSNTTTNLQGIAYGNGTFVTVGERGTILTSP
jgi:hypothetical protein